MKNIYTSFLFRFNMIIILSLGSLYQSVAQGLPINHGVYFLQNVATKQFMEVGGEGSSVYKSTQINQYNQQFTIRPADEDNTRFLIYSYNNEGDEALLSFSVLKGGLNANPDGTNLVLQEEENTVGSQWLIEPTGNPLTFILRSADTKKVIGVHDASKPEIIQWSLDATKDTRFQWRLVPVIMDGTYFLKNRSTGKVMDVSSFLATNAAKIGQVDLKDEETEDLRNQKFELKQMDEKDVSIFSLSPTHSKGTKFLDNAKLANEQLQIWKSQDADAHIKWYIKDVSVDYDNQFVVIQSTATNRIIGVNTSSDTRVIMGNSNLSTDPRFQWELVYADEVPYLTEGRYQIVNKSTKKVWDIPYKSLALNTVVNEFIDNKGTNQQFDITINDNAQYIISPVHSRGTRYVLVNGASKESNIDGTALRLWNSQHPAAEFEIYPLEEKTTTDEEYGNDIVYGIRSKYSNLDIGVHNHSGKTEVMQWDYVGGVQGVQNDARFQWVFEPMYQQEDIKPGRYIIQNVATGKVLDITGMGKNVGTAVQQANLLGLDNQKFELKPNGDGYTIRPLHAKDLYLNVSGAAAANTNNSPVTVWVQDWRVEQFGLDLIGYDSNENPLYTITSLFSNLNIGVHNSQNSQVIQWNVNWGIENDPRFQWRFIQTKSAAAREMIEESASIAETTAVPQIEVFPNPSVETFSVNITDFEEKENLILLIVDSQGNQVLRKDIGKERKLSFDATSLGLKQHTYVIQIHNGSDKRVSKILKFEE